MAVESASETHRESEAKYEREVDLKAFDESKAGVKGLVDAGVMRVPRIFIHQPQHVPQSQPNNSSSAGSNFDIPVIDFGDIDKDSGVWAETVNKIRNACENWGFFQLINHGIPSHVMEEMLDGVRSFHEQDVEVKRGFYTRDYTKKVIYNSNYDLFQAKSACWRDTLALVMAPHPPIWDEMPSVCREIMVDYTDKIMKLGAKVYELLSEALGLVPNHLKDMGCADGVYVVCNYYPPCPEPELTLGQKSHADSGFITLLLQDQIGGLQVLHENQWVDVNPVPGALVFNVGDLLKLISNGKFVSAYHRALSHKVGPRVSVAYIFRAHLDSENSSSRMYGPIKELLSEENPPLYRSITVKELIAQKHSRRPDGVSMLDQFKLQNSAI